MKKRLKKLLNRGVPIIAIETADTIATINSIAESDIPTLVWDAVEGVRAANHAARSILSQLKDHETLPAHEAVREFANVASTGSVLVIANAHRLLELPLIQALENARDDLKTAGATVVLVGVGFRLPPELQDDVFIIDDPLPDRMTLRRMLSQIVENADGVDLSKITERQLDTASEALLGLSLFAAEQVAALSLTPYGFDLDQLWERKRRMIAQTEGLSVWIGGERFEDVRGLDNVKSFMIRIVTGRNRPLAIVWIDEIEKALAGASGAVADSSGVSQDQLRVLLTYMQDHQAPGVIFIGVPGSGKSLVAKAAGSLTNIPVIAFDLGAMKGSLVGESEHRIRAALRVITAISDGRPLFIATCNSIVQLPPELRRRFTLGTFFFDLPSPEERAQIWALYKERFGIPPDDPIPDDDGWTGAEIRNCCEIAWRLEIPLAQAASFIVPVSRSAAETIRQMREMAVGRFISASSPGVYEIPEPRRERRFSFKEEG